MTTVALALGSGGARGYAHIGVLEVLAERGYDVVAVSGSSMGALVGGVYAAGHLDAYSQWVRSLGQWEVVKLLDISLSAPGVIHAEKILDKVREIVGGATIESLPVPFTAVATDLATGRPIWFQRGPVDVAIRASIAIPGVITPHVVNGRVFVDGGLIEPVPLGPLTAHGADLVIAVDVGADSGPGQEADETDTEEPVGFWDSIIRSTAPLVDNDVVRSVSGMLFGPPRTEGARPDGETDRDTADDIPAPGSSEEPKALSEEKSRPQPPGRTRGVASMASSVLNKLSAFTVMDRSIDIMQEALARYQLASFPPDVLIQVPRTSMNTLDFHRAGEMIDLGRALTEKALDEFVEHGTPHLQRARRMPQPLPETTDSGDAVAVAE